MWFHCGNSSRLHFGRVIIKLGAVAIYGVLLAFLAAGCGQSEKARTVKATLAKPHHSAKAQPPEKKSASSNTAKAEFQKAHMLWADEKGRTVFDAAYKSASLTQSGKDAVVELRGVSAKLYADGRISSTLSAPHVMAYSKTRQVTADGGVLVQSVTAEASAQCQNLLWKPKENKIIGYGNVRMVRRNMSVLADNFKADTGLKKAVFSGGAELKLN